MLHGMVARLPRPIGGIAHRATPPHGMMLDGMMTPHANPHSAHRAIGTLMTIPRFPSHPLPSRLLRSPVSPTASWPSTQTHCLPCYPGSPPVRRHKRGRGTHTEHTCCTHMNDQDRTKGTSRWLHRSPGTVWNLPSGPLPVVPPCSVRTLIPVFTPRRLWASWGCR